MKSKVKCYAKPYEGTEPFLFFSYCHEDESIDFSIIERLQMEGVRVWYDDGIHPGDDWLDIIADHIDRSACCLAAISSNSVQSHNCKKELAHCVESGKALVPVLLDSFHMPGGTKLLLASCNYIEKFKYSEEEKFYEVLLSSEKLKSCRVSGGGCRQLELWRSHFKEYTGQTEEIQNAKSFGGTVKKYESEKQQLLQLQEDTNDLYDQTVGRFGASLKVIHKAQALVEETNILRRKLNECSAGADETGRQLIADCDLLLKDLKEYLKECGVDPDKDKTEKEKKEELGKLEELESGLKKLQESYEDSLEQYDDIEDMSIAPGMLKKKEKKLSAVLSDLRDILEKAEQAEKENTWKYYTEQGAEQNDFARKLLQSAGHLADGIQEELKEIREEIERNAKKAVLVRLSTGEILKLPKASSTCGRNSNSCDVVIEGNASVSKEQFQISESQGEYFICDLDSALGTQLNLVPLKEKEKRVLKNQSVIKAAGENFIFYDKEKAKEIVERGQIVTLESLETGEIHILDSREVLLDRGHKDEWNEPTLRDKHIHRKGHTKLFYKDGWRAAHNNFPEDGEEEPNPTYVNGVPISQPYGNANSVLLRSGDIVSAYHSDFRFTELTLKEIKK